MRSRVQRQRSFGLGESAGAGQNQRVRLFWRVLGSGWNRCVGVAGFVDAVSFMCEV